jgi:hypothetical protein
MYDKCVRHSTIVSISAKTAIARVAAIIWKDRRKNITKLYQLGKNNKTFLKC